MVHLIASHQKMDFAHYLEMELWEIELWESEAVILISRKHSSLSVFQPLALCVSNYFRNLPEELN